MGLRLKHLACGAAAVFPFSLDKLAFAQTMTVAIGATGNVGNVVSAPSATTTFTINPSTGSFTPSGGTAVRLTPGNALVTITASCGAQSSCGSTNAKIKVQNVGSPSGRLGALTNFKVVMGTATLVGSLPAAGNPITFSIGPIGMNGSKTVLLGLDIPVLGNGVGSPATGSASSSFVVSIGPSTYTATSTGAALAAVFRPISISKSTELVFGRIVRPSTGSGTVTMDGAGALSTTAGNIVTNSAHSPAVFVITGEGSQSINVQVPSTFSMTSGAHSLLVSTIPSVSGTQAFSGALGASAAVTLGVGGSFPISNSTFSGNYSGNFLITISYN